jgi:hypothetical protein
MGLVNQDNIGRPAMGFLWCLRNVTTIALIFYAYLHSNLSFITTNFKRGTHPDVGVTVNLHDTASRVSMMVHYAVVATSCH